LVFCRSDIVFILTCANFLLPWLQGSFTTPSMEVMGVHQNCEFLLALGVVQSSSLQQLLDALSQLDIPSLRKVHEAGVWQQWVEQNLSHFTNKEIGTPTIGVKSATPLSIKDYQAATPYNLKRVLLPFTHPRSSDGGVILQVSGQVGIKSGCGCTALLGHQCGWGASSVGSAGGWGGAEHCTLYSWNC